MADNNIFKKPGEMIAQAAAGTQASVPEAPAQTDDQTVDTVDEPKIDELTILKQRAKLMGVTFSNNIGLDALRAKVNAATQGEASSAESDDDGDEPEEATEAVPTRTLSLREKLQAEQLKLVRIRVTCLDPKKKDLPGEIFTVGNKHIGTIRKFVPFGEMTDNGYHVPHIIYNMMKEREFVMIRTRKTPRGPIVEHSMAREFAIEVLPPLTETEIADMRAAQASRGDQL